MDLGAVQTTLTSWIETYSGVEVEWGRLPQVIHPSAFVLAYLGAITKAGHDERIQVYDFDSDSTSVTVVGVRRMVVRLSFRSFDQRLGGSARQFAENFRVALHSQTSWDTLRDAELSYIDTGELVDSDYIWSGRMVSQTDMDLILGIRASTADTEHDGSYIKFVNIDTQEYVVTEDDEVVVDVSGDFITVDTD